MLVAQLFRGAVDLGRSSDICLYHLGCFKLVMPDGRDVYLAAVVLAALQQQQQQQWGLDQLLEAFRQAGAVLHISVPKCKQCSIQRKKNGGHSIDWLSLRKPLLPPEPSLLPHSHLGFVHGLHVVGQGCGDSAPADAAQGQQYRKGCAKAARAGRLPGAGASRQLESAPQPGPRQLCTIAVPAAASSSSNR